MNTRKRSKLRKTRRLCGPVQRSTVKRGMRGGFQKKRSSNSDSTRLFGHLALVSYALDPDETAFLEKVLSRPISNSILPGTTGPHDRPYTYHDLLKAISLGWKRPIYLYGGSVRDMVRTKFHDITAFNDIDINYTSSSRTVKKALERLPHLRFGMDEEAPHRAWVGKDRTKESLEGIHISPRYYDIDSLESKCNSLALKVEAVKAGNGATETATAAAAAAALSFTLLDFFGGQSIHDAERKIYSAPLTAKQYNDPDAWNTWLSGSMRSVSLSRMLKFSLKGYTIEPKTACEIYKFWYKHRDQQKWPNVFKYVEKQKESQIRAIIKHHFTTLRDCSLPGYEEFMSLIPF